MYFSWRWSEWWTKKINPNRLMSITKWTRTCYVTGKKDWTLFILVLGNKQQPHSNAISYNISLQSFNIYYFMYSIPHYRVYTHSSRYKNEMTALYKLLGNCFISNHVHIGIPNMKAIFFLYRNLVNLTNKYTSNVPNNG